MLGNSGLKNEDKKMLDISGDDFASPVVFKKFKKSSLNPIPFSNKCKMKKSSKKKQVTLDQMVKQNLQYSDVNPEHLQMALALSRSISDDQIHNTNDEIPWTSDEQKYEKRGTLLEFGFKSNKIKMRSENKLSKKDTWRTNKKSKFRFITPILYLRSEEDRESLVQSKLSLILNQNMQENSWGHEELDSADIMSEELLKINCSDCCIFHLNYKFNEFSRLSFSVPDLIILENRAECGFLLKDWKSIPLREHSPDRLEDLKQKSNKLENKIEFCSKENLRYYEDKGHESTINELIPHKLGSSNSNIHKKVETRDFNTLNANILKTELEYRTDMCLTLSPDLFEDEQSKLSTDAPIGEISSSNAKKSLEKLFSEVDTSETHIRLDDTNTLSNNPSIIERLEFTVQKNVSENIVISSYSDEEVLEKNDQENTNESRIIDLRSINSIEKKCLEVIPEKLLQPVAMQNIHNLGTKSGLAIDDMSTEYTDHRMDLNHIASSSQLDENITNSNKNKEYFETKINNIDCQLQSFKDISYTSDETYKVNSNNDLINSIFYPASEAKFPIKLKSNINYKSVLQKNLYEHQKQCSSYVIENDGNISEFLPSEECSSDVIENDGNISEFLPSEEKIFENLSPVHYTNISPFNKDNYINKNNLVENKVTSRSFQSSLAVINDCEKLDNISVCNPISKSYKEITSLNVTEHIEEMLARSYSPITTNISGEDSSTSLNKQTELFESQKLSISGSSAFQKKLLSPYCQTLMGNSQHSPTFDIHISDEEINYSSNIRTNEENFNKNNEDVEVSNKNEVIGYSYKTPLRRYASFTESSSAKETSTFGRNKNESDITPNGKFIVKTENITPMINYAEFDTPSIVKELGKYGLKPLKRKRGVNLLKHIYEATHPIVEAKGQIVEGNKVLKKAKKDKCEIVSQKVESIVSDNLLYRFHPVEPWTETIYERDLIFERQRSSKIATCQIPLQIVWHNFLVQNPEIRENILLYEPLQVDTVCKMLKEQGFKFHLQDLLTFLDRKCITIRIPQNHNNMKI